MSSDGLSYSLYILHRSVLVSSVVIALFAPANLLL
jgi:hypothetical protein